MNNKVKKQKHKRTDMRGHRYDRCPANNSKFGGDHCNENCGTAVCRCGKKRPLNNKVEG